MRVGEREDPTKTRNTDYALIMEDINLDSSSFVLSTNQLIEFKFASNDDVYFRSAGTLNKNPLIRNSETKLTPLSNNQSLLNSGRLVLNAKTDNIILSAEHDFISLTNRDTILDTGNDFVIGGEQIHLLSDTAEGQAEFTVAIADKVIDAFEKLIDALLAPGAYTSLGPMVFPSGIIPKLQKIRLDLDDISSDLVKIEK